MGIFLIPRLALFVLFLPLGVPVFFDLVSLNFIFSDVFVVEEVGIPIPIGGITFSICAVFMYVHSFFKSSDYYRLVSPQYLFLIMFFSIIPFLLFSYFWSGLSVVRIVQLVIPVLGLSVICIPRSPYYQSVMLFGALVGASFFVIIHAVSLFLNNSNFSDISNVDFSFVFGLLIYQSLVTYNAVLMLYLFLLLAVCLSSNYSWFSRLLSLLLVIVFFVVILAAGRRVSMFEFLGGMGILALFYLYYILIRNKISVSSIILFPFILVLGYCALSLFLISPLFERSATSISENRFDSGRLDIYRQAFDFFYNNLSVLAFGAGGSSSVGYHNYFLDTFYRVGMVGFFILSLGVIVSISRVVKVAKDLDARALFRGGFLSVLLYLLFLQVTLNSGLTQPYYLINLLFVLICLVFFVFRVNVVRR